MRKIEKIEQQMVNGGFFAQVMGALAGAVGNTVSTAQGNSNATPGQLGASAAVGAAAGTMATVPGLQTAALTTITVGNAAIAASSSPANNCSQQCTPSNVDSCGGGGGCFLVGTRIKMADGFSKSIENIQIGDLIIEALSGKAVRVTGLKTIMHNKNHWIFSLEDSTAPYMTECHPWYDEHNELCAMSGLAERLAPWLGPIKIVEVKNKIKLSQSVPVYNLMLEEGESHYANDVPVSNIVKNGGAWVLYLKGYIDNEVYCDIARNPENHQFDPAFQTRFFNAVNSLSDFVAKNDNICGHAVGKMMAHGFRNRHRIEPLLRKWVNNPIRKKVFARANA